MTVTIGSHDRNWKQVAPRLVPVEFAAKAQLCERRSAVISSAQVDDPTGMEITAVGRSGQVGFWRGLPLLCLESVDGGTESELAAVVPGGSRAPNARDRVARLGHRIARAFRERSRDLQIGPLD